MRWFLRNRKDFTYIALLLALLGGVYLLPPDTALKLVRESGVLRVCVPSAYPPLVTGDAEAPGVDIEILRQVADDMGVRLLPVTNSNMGRDFNPRNWRVTRAQCAVLAGGVVATDLTRSFLDTTSPYLETGWALIAPGEPASLEGLRVGFHAGISGLDRISLSRFLREHGAQVSIMGSKNELVAALAAGDVQAGVSEAILAQQVAGENGWQAFRLSDELTQAPVSFGLWKGDLTLKRALQASLAKLRASGELDAIFEKYNLNTLASFAF